ncbi:MAG: ABC transporter permease [Polyangiaceae bacterium]
MSTMEEVETDEKDTDEEESEEEEESEKVALRKPEASETTRVIRTGEKGSLRNVFTIARREMRAYFDSLTAYVVLGGSALGLGVYFFLLQQGGFWQVDRASMSRLFEFMAGSGVNPGALAVLVIPLVTMRAIAEEKRSGTLELLITLPVRDSDVILGKFFAAWGMCLVLLVATLAYPLAMFWKPWHLGNLDWGPVWTGYLGLALYCAAGTALGIMFSALTESQIIAFFFTAGSLVLLNLLGNLVELVHGWMGDAIAFVSFQSRFAAFERGQIDTRAVVYFVSIAVLCLLVAFRSLESRKWS